MTEAHTLLDKALDNAREMHFTRGVLDILLKQAILNIGEQRFDEAKLKLDEILPLLEEVRDRSYEAQYSYIEARVCDACGSYFQAKGSYEKALDAFERLGMNDRAAETKAALEAVMNKLDQHVINEA